MNQPVQTRNPLIVACAAGGKLICFFLPWILVSCQNQPVMSVSGWQLAVGSTVQTSFGPQIIEARPDLLLILLAAIASLALGVMVLRGVFALRRAAVAWISLAALSLIWLGVRFAGVEASASAQGGAGVQVQMQFGYWGVVLACWTILIVGALSLRRAPSPVPLASVAPSPPTLVATPDPPVAQIACPACGAANPAEYRFCMTCGSPMSAAVEQQR